MGIRIIKLPDVGEGVAEAEVVEWHVAVGQSVLEDQILAAVMTDKATVEIPSPVAGTVLALGVEVGGVLAVGAELVRLEVAGEESGEMTAAPRE
ncbi:MAG: biotin/lipoyl-containing protein, partial [Reyranella sp.]|nr:biotin/lipoyl-containing protein [Reyranella sp.]